MAKLRREVGRMWDARAETLTPYEPVRFPEPNPAATPLKFSELREVVALKERMKKAGF